MDQLTLLDLVVEQAAVVERSRGDERTRALNVLLRLRAQLGLDRAIVPNQHSRTATVGFGDWPSSRVSTVDVIEAGAVSIVFSVAGQHFARSLGVCPAQGLRLRGSAP